MYRLNNILSRDVERSMDAALLTASRQDRGLALSKDKRLRPIAGDKWLVPSQSQATGGYVVDAQAHTCTCPDHETTGGKCKHQWAVEFTMRASVTTPDGSEVQVQQTVRVTYGQHWQSYNAAQTTEKEHIGRLLAALCEGIENPPQKMGRPRLPLADVVHAAAMKVYVGMSGRRAATDVRECAAKGLIDKAPHYNSIHGLLERTDVTPLLTGLVEASAGPLAGIERDFAADSTGFATSVYHRWFDRKYGHEMKAQRWIKAHAMVGTVTNVVTAIRITAENGADCPELPALVATTARRFDMGAVSADKAYLSHENLKAIEAAGAVPFIPFKVNSTGEGSDAWRRMWGLFQYRREEFLANYHRRSNVETTFSAIKRKFGGSVRAKLFESQVNEVLLKCLCHNLSCVVQAMHKLGVEPAFSLGEAVQ